MLSILTGINKNFDFSSLSVSVNFDVSSEKLHAVSLIFSFEKVLMYKSFLFRLREALHFLALNGVRPRGRALCPSGAEGFPTLNID